MSKKKHKSKFVWEEEGDVELVEEGTELAEPNCYKRKCLWFWGVEQIDGTETSERLTCEAFPEGIPSEIAYGDNPHTDPFPGDQGIQYEPEP